MPLKKASDMPVVSWTVAAPTVRDIPDVKPHGYDSAKDKRISYAGIWQACAQSPALMQYAPTLEAYLDLVDKAAEHGIRFINR